MGEVIREEDKRDDYVVVDLEAFFYCNIHWLLFARILKEDFFYAIRLCFVYIFSGEYRFSELVSSYLHLYNLDDLVNQDIASFLRIRKGKVYFCTTMCSEICEKVFSDYQDIFSGYLNSSKQFSLRGDDKLDAIKTLVKDSCLTYLGCTKHDLEIWKHCDTIGVVMFYNYTSSLLKKVKALNKEYFVFYVNKKEY